MTNHEKKPCLLCKFDCDVYRQAKHLWTEYVCKNCGDFIVSDSVDKNSYKLLAGMYYFLLHNAPREKRYFFVDDESKFKDDDGAVYIGLKTLENIYPRDFSQRIDMILLNLATIFCEIGQYFGYGEKLLKTANDSVIRLAFFVDKDDSNDCFTEVNGVFSLLSQMGYLSPLTRQNAIIKEYSISAIGWLRIQELQAKGAAISQGFIAMWFDPQMDTAKAKILSAIHDSGYVPMIISDKEHNNQIVPEILFEIKRSAFLVADLTGHRNGVYYEAGYAHALKKEVILTCREKDFEDRHFDVSQKNIIIWKDEAELHEKLMKRIEATVGKNL